MSGSGRTFSQALFEEAVLFFDGGLGTMLQAKGLPAGMSPELFSLENRDVLLSIHAEYIGAGADVITTNTFGGNAFKLPSALDAFAFNREMASLAREAADKSGRRVFVAGSVGPTGQFLRPLGELSFAELLQVYMDQIRGLAQGGVDLLQIETQIDLAEARIAVLAARRTCSLPISVSMTYEDGSTLTGSSPEVCAATLGNMGVEILAVNCGAGPEEMRDTVESLLAFSSVPVLAQPNAGLPELAQGRTVFRLAPEPFAEFTAKFVSLGVKLVGGCCGTTPEHIAALRQVVGSLEIGVRKPPETAGVPCISVSSRSRVTRIGGAAPFCLVGERINPTGKKKFSAELVAGEFTQAMTYAAEQIEAGAQLLDVNVGAPQVDELKTLPDLVARLSARFQIPLALDSSDPRAIEASLEVYPGSPLINSISGEPGRMEFLGPLCRDYGAPFILLPLKGRNLPATFRERALIVEVLLKKMEDLKIPRHLALVDCLVLTVSSQAEAAVECLKFIRYCAETLKVPSIAGLSNISFGLPARELLNASFLTLGAGVGLSACIANPDNRRIREAAAASDLLLGRDRNAVFFISNYAEWTPTSAQGTSIVRPQENAALLTPEQAVIFGAREEILPLIDKALAEGESSLDIVNERLIPAITEVGRRFERKEYFLPQLLRSAEAMQAAVARLRPLLEEAEFSEKRRNKIVMATVEGDIHDIGKNIVSLMLENHGFEVLDLGKDIKAEDIVNHALELGAGLIGLSALMTTTMVRMRDTLDLLKKRQIEHIKVLVGGAVVTRDFAQSIGAHGYAGDAVEAVRVAADLAGK